MKLIEYSSDKYGRIPTVIETGYRVDPGTGLPEPSPSQETVQPPATQEVSDFVFIATLVVIVFILLWK